MIIREMNEKDFVEVAALRKETFEKINSQEYNPLQIQSLVNDASVSSLKEKAKTRKMFCLENQGIILGTIDLQKNEIAGMITRIDHLRTGIGSQLLNFIEDYAKKNGIKQLILFATPLAVTFYEKNKYKNFGKYDHQGKDGVILQTYKMEKEIK